MIVDHRVAATRVAVTEIAACNTLRGEFPITCSRFTVYWCNSPSIPCCFTGALPAPHERRIQVCFCNANADGSIERSLFYAMGTRYMALINCFYLLGHMCGFAVELASQWKQQISPDSAYDPLAVFLSPLRRSLNASMVTLYLAIKFENQPGGALQESRPP